MTKMVTIIKKYTLLNLIMPGVLSILTLACSSTQKAAAPLSYDPPGSTNTKTKPIKLQEKGSFSIDGITVNNDFDGARMNGFSKLNDSVYQINIQPENVPINMSPWYSFKVKSDTRREVYIHLNYQDGKHRYYPDFSQNGNDWQPLDSTRYLVHENDSAILKLELTPEYLWISAQELMTSKHNEDWVNKMSSLDFITKESPGNSRNGKPIHVLNIASDEKQPLLVVISRQHPPELTGYIAMKAFIQEIAADTELSRRFRAQFSTVLVPMMNPDGVDNGHWRHNAGGVDLNRDWQFFNQPEIDQFQKYVHRSVKNDGHKVVLGLDFHSTHEDLLYTFNDETYKAGDGIVKDWISGLRKAFPGEVITEQEGGAGSPVSKNWFLHQFGAEAVTYEVGDNTPRTFVGEKGRVSAQIIMELLLKKYGK